MKQIGHGKLCFMCGTKTNGSKLCKKCGSDKAVNKRNQRRFLNKPVKGINGVKYG